MTNKGREGSMKTNHLTSANAWHKLGSPRARRLLVLAIILLPCLALAQVPLITQVSPPSVAPNAFVPLIITGTGFANSLSTLVEVTTSPGTTATIPTFYISSTELEALYNAPSSAAAVFVKVLSNGLTSNAIPLPITTSGSVVFGNTSICFGVYSNSACTAGTGPQSIALGDFNGDGKLDIAIVNSTADNVSILLSKGDGTFLGLIPEIPPSPSTPGSPYGASTLATYPVGHNPQAVVVGDFNNDGKLDLAVANENDNTVSILLGNGDGTFQAQTTVGSGAAAPVALAVADFDGDGNLDFAVVNQTDKNNCGSNTGDGSVFVFTGSGTPSPTFTQYKQPNCVGILPTSVVAANFSNSSALPDLVVSNEGGNSSANCPPADGTVTFIPSYYVNGFTLFGLKDYCAGKGPSAAVASDFNGDGTLDLVVTNATGAQIAFLPGNGSFFSFNFQTPATFPAGGLVPNSIVAGDFNGDGILDIAVADQGSSQVSILQGDGHGNFNPANGSPYATTTAYGGRGPTSLVAADFNGDGRLDIATADNSDNFVTIMLQSPAIQFSPSSLNFNLVPEGSVSTAQTVKVTNTGLVSATVSSVGISGQFKLDTPSTTCPTAPFPLAGSSSCFIGVTFDPTSIGTETGALTLQTSTGQAVNVSLAGSGIAPVLNFSPGTVTFGGVLVGTPAPTITVNVTNVGDYTATINSISIPDVPEFGETDTCIGSSLPAGSGTCTITVSFTPSAAGLRTSPMNISFSITGGGSSIPATVALSGDGTAPTAFFTPTPLTFANQPVTTPPSPSPASTVYLLNDGTAPLTITSISLTGINQSDFSFQNINCPISPATPLAVSTSCSVNVTFAPSAEGQRTATLQFTDNNGAVNGSTQTVGLSGNGTGPLVSISGAPVIFGNQPFGTTSGPATVSLSNLGNGPLTINSVALGGANPGDFHLTNSCPLSPTQLPMFGSCSATITFTPTAVGSRTATLTFTDNNFAVPGQTQTVTLSGTSTASTGTLSTGSVAFGGVPVNTSAPPISFMLTNTGTAPLTVYSIQISPPTGEFTQTNNCIGTLVTGGNCTVIVNFTPSTSGLRTATLTITDNSGVCATCSTTQTVSLSGTGTDFSISVSPASQTVSPGKVALFTLTLAPISGFNGSVTLGCTISPPTVGTTCTVPAGTVTISGGAQKHIGVSAKPKKGTYTLTFSATYTATPPSVGTITRSTTAKVISK
jgi:hypothetical protein